MSPSFDALKNDGVASLGATFTIRGRKAMGWILAFWLLVFFCLLLHPKENCGCLTLYALVTFVLLAPVFLGKTSMYVLATSVFIVGLLVCAVNIVEARRRRTVIPFIGGVFLFLGVASFPREGNSYFYYAQKYVYLFVFFDASISMGILSGCYFACNYLRRLLRLNVFNADGSRREVRASENQENVEERKVCENCASEELGK
ncbi:MAG: hypothetical protein IJZ10_12340 [Thermoguttaceae bacterium]|nr:hypothetical protein [Thermoguttaceae bacterium]